MPEGGRHERRTLHPDTQGGAPEPHAPAARDDRPGRPRIPRGPGRRTSGPAARLSSGPHRRDLSGRSARAFHRSHPERLPPGAPTGRGAGVGCGGPPVPLCLAPLAHPARGRPARHPAACAPGLGAGGRAGPRRRPRTRLRPARRTPGSRRRPLRCPAVRASRAGRRIHDRRLRRSRRSHGRA